MSAYLPSLFFTVDIEHSHDLAATLREEGVKAYPVSGDTPTEERRKFIRLFKDGAIDGLVSCGIFSEGTDLPNAAGGMMCRPTKSQQLYIQQIGRLLRKFPAPQGDRPYQTEAINSIVDDYNAGLRYLLLVLATGTGKTFVASSLPDVFQLARRRRLLFLVHRDELCFQAAEGLQAGSPGRTVGIEKAGLRCGDADLVVGSVQTLGTVSPLDGGYNKRLRQLRPEDFDIVIVDEAHHVTGTNYQAILRYFEVLKSEENRNPSRLLLGLTATPNRGDSVGLECVFEKITYEYGIRPAIKDGWLVPIQAFRVETETDISKVKSSGGDFQIGSLENAVNTPERNLLIARKYKEICNRDALQWGGIKDAAVIVDFCDVTAKHSLQTVPSLFGLRQTFDAKGKDIVEQVEEVERLEAANPGLDLRALPNLDSIRSSLRRIDLLAPPIVPPELRKLSLYKWMLESEGAYHLVLPRQEMLTVRQNTLGQYEISKHSKGIRRLQYVAMDLREAMKRADAMVDPESEKILRADAGWHKDPPALPQCSYLWRLDKGLRHDYRDGNAFYQFATARFEAGDLRYTKGAISRMLDSKMAAK